MAIQTLRPKNQVTIPAAIVEDVGIEVGDPITFRVEQGRIIIEALPVVPNEEWLTDQVLLEIERAEREQGASFETADEAIAALRG
ncbi:MAG: AbrB/MazE/SpoVT family DNA-binding domain-containing protein [Candidatus Nanopelagicales bacterium]|nr:AbrB/MazE/SpoVT family DNA-binding domain-containing protein [Candidatus Nanopelagicales bacterium]